MKTFKSFDGDGVDCFIDTDEIAAIIPWWFNGGETQGSLIILKSGREIKVFGTPEDVKESYR